MKRIAFLGLGAMGSRMAANLIKSGYDVTVWNRSAAAMDDLVGLGARAASRVVDAVAGAELVISMVRDDEASESIWLGADGALAAMDLSALAMECSTLSVPHVLSLSEAFQHADKRFIDAPLAGSRPQAEAGQLIFLVGGDAGDVAEAGTVLDAMGSAVHHLGPVGAGASVKLMVNALLGIQLAAGAELLGLAQARGLDLGGIVDVIGSTPVCSPALKGSMAAMIAGQFAPAFPIDLVAKDFGLLAKSASGLMADLPVSGVAEQIYKDATQSGLGADNITGIVQRYIR